MIVFQIEKVGYAKIAKKQYDQNFVAFTVILFVKNYLYSSDGHVYKFIRAPVFFHLISRDLLRLFGSCDNGGQVR